MPAFRASLSTACAVCLNVVAATLPTPPALAKEQNAIEVSQPGPYGISTTTYIVWAYGYPIEVSHTTTPNTVMYLGKPTNMNSAALCGIRVKLVPRPEMRPNGTYESMVGFGVYGDTARVMLDLTAVPDTLPAEFQSRGALARVVEETVSCIFLNAKRRSELNYVWLEVEGPQAYKSYAGVFPLADVPDPCNVSLWSARSILGYVRKLPE